MNYTGTMDKECVQLCNAINLIKGITTHNSCCGHNKDEYHIWFMAKTLKSLPELLYWFDGCHCGFYDWRVIINTDCAMSPVAFMVEGPIGIQAYEQANEIARFITEDQKKP